MCSLPQAVTEAIDSAINSDDATAVGDAWRNIYNYVESVKATYWPPIAVDAVCYVFARAILVNKYPLDEVANDLMHNWPDIPAEGRSRIIKIATAVLSKDVSESAIFYLLNALSHPIEGEAGIARCKHMYVAQPLLRPHILGGLADRARMTDDLPLRERYERAHADLQATGR